MLSYHLQRYLADYKKERRGPTFIAYQSVEEVHKFRENVPITKEFPVLTIHNKSPANYIEELTWQKVSTAPALVIYLITCVNFCVTDHPNILRVTISTE